MLQHLGIGVITQGTETEKDRIEAKLLRKGSLRNGLRSTTTNTGNADKAPSSRAFDAAEFLPRQGQQRFEEIVFRIANRELGRMDANRYTTGACGRIIAPQRALP